MKAFPSGVPYAWPWMPTRPPGRTTRASARPGRVHRCSTTPPSTGWSGSGVTLRPITAFRRAGGPMEAGATHSGAARGHRASRWPSDRPRRAAHLHPCPGQGASIRHHRPHRPVAQPIVAHAALTPTAYQPREGGGGLCVLGVRAAGRTWIEAKARLAADRYVVCEGTIEGRSSTRRQTSLPVIGRRPSRRAPASGPEGRRSR